MVVFGHHETHVRVSLVVRVRSHVDRQAIHIDSEVGAVIQADATQKVWIGLAAAAVLGGDHAGDERQYLARTRSGPLGNGLSALMLP